MYFSFLRLLVIPIKSNRT